VTAMALIATSEWRKLRSIPTMWWLLAGTVLLCAIGAVGGLMVAEVGNLPLNTGEGLQTALHSVGFGSILAEVAGIIGMAGEFRFGQADQTFLSEPRRGRVVTAKAALFAAVGLVFGMVSAAATLAASWTWLTAKGVGLPFGQSLIWSSLGGGIASATLSALLGVAVGAVLRNQVVAIVMVLAVQAGVETTVFQASSSVGRWLPGRAAEALRQLPTDGLLAWQTGALVLSAWVSGLLLVGAVRTLRTDIT
jgi:ABC-2 type transport system permease protein